MPTTAKALPPIQALPYAARQLALILGVEDTLKLSLVAEHRHVYVPKVLTAECRLVRDIGWVVAMQLHKHFAGELVHVPKCHQADMTEAQVAAIHRLVAHGADRGDLAEALGLSESGVRAILARCAQTPTQPGKYCLPHPPIGSSRGGDLRVENGRSKSLLSDFQ